MQCTVGFTALNSGNAILNRLPTTSNIRLYAFSFPVDIYFQMHYDSTINDLSVKGASAEQISALTGMSVVEINSASQTKGNTADH